MTIINGTNTITVINNGSPMQRSFLLHLPSSYVAGTLYPLVLVFHGGGGTPSNMESRTNFSSCADTNNFIVVYPEGIGGHWNDNSGIWNTTINDVEFVRQLLTRLQAQFNINSKNIYACGFSDGADMCNRLAIEASHLFAAVGIDEGMLLQSYASNFQSLGPIAVIGIQGTRDPIDPYNGGTTASGKTVVDFNTTSSLWAQNAGCGPTPAITHETQLVNDGTTVYRYDYTGGIYPVTWFAVHGMGHAWPPAAAEYGNTSQNIDATNTFWTFFSGVVKQ